MLAPYFREAGFEVHVPAGFGAWRQEVLDGDSALRRFGPDMIFDVTSHDDVLAREVPGFWDERMGKIASMPYSLAGIEAIVDECRWAAIASPKKVLAVDADNTLWRGVLSEDGKEALEPYAEFQRALIDLRSQGVLLVLLTKNDPSDDFMRHDMPLADCHFSARKINWAPKAGNLIAACAELGLATDSVVFVDDNPYERAQMSAHLPDVAVAPFPENGLTAPAQFMRRLKEYFFAGAGTTREDALRADDYMRQELSRSTGATNLEDYLLSLELRVAPRSAEEGDIPRLAQMAGKTNQFNATTIRRTTEDFEGLLADGNKRIYVFLAADRFGEQGIVAYAIADLTLCRITDFVMSCRAMGRTLEHFVYGYLVRVLGAEYGIDYSPTSKNAPIKAFLDSADKFKTYYKTCDL